VKDQHDSPLLQIFIHNRTALANGTTLFSSLAALVSSIARKTNTLANARLNISAHYDISNAMFAAFLSPDMTYSCALWSPRSSLQAAQETLEEAQVAKLQLFIDGAHLQRSDHVLEIGSGWGSFAIAAVRQTGCHVTTLTLSREQKALAEERITEAGLSAHIDVLLCDYRALPPPSKGHYDKVISIEMLEAVGAEYLETYFGCVDRLLKPNGGIAMFQCITIPEARYEAYAKGNDFIRQYIFPGGHLPTISQLVRSIDSGSQGKLVVDEVRNIGDHYAKTLRLWNDNFQKNFESQVRPALLDEHPKMNEEDVELFRRKWEVSGHRDDLVRAS
jgi:cyclopropane-fatty-acyl-phospholipid synthase